METERILYYTDGQEVTVTDSGLKVRKTLYQFNGITHHSISVIHPMRAPFTALTAAGLIIFTCGALSLMPSTWTDSSAILGLKITSLMMFSGIVLAALGLLVMLQMKDKYAVRIITREGEKNVVVSPNREYISRIVDGLNRANLDLR